MARYGLSVDGLSADVLDAFVSERRAQGYRILVSRRGLEPLLSFLRQRDAAPRWEWRVPAGPGRGLLERYGEYLRLERGLAPLLIKVYVGKAALFLAGVRVTGGGALVLLSTAEG